MNQPHRHPDSKSRKSAPVCSICIANYNGEGLLADCIDSILGQRGDFEIEIVVHDDASSDLSVLLLRERYPQVTVIESTENVGFCIANNRMARIATGDYLLLLNNDAALFPDALATLHDWAQEQSPPGILSLPQYDWHTGALVDRGCRLDPFYNPIPNLDPERRDVAMVIGACLWIPRKAWSELGGFPDWFESISEDLLLCCSARLRGYPVQVPPGSGYWHRQGASFGGNRVADGRLATTFKRRRLSERNKTFVMIACTPTWLLPFLLPIHLLLLSIEGVIMSLLRRNLEIWRTIYAPVLPSIICQRARLVAMRHEMPHDTASSRRYLRQFSPWPHKLAMLIRHGLPTIR
jgi:GT2 family glycosyltransferase